MGPDSLRSASFFHGPLRLDGRGVHGNFHRLLGGLLIAAALLPALLATRIFLLDASASEGAGWPFSDATTYLAAGERLNAGHELYRLAPGDRAVLILADTFTAPLLSPPPVAVIWRPLAEIPGGYQIWVISVWIVLLGTVITLVVRTGLIGVLASLALFLAIAEQLAAANVAAFFPALLVVAWDRRLEPWTGALTGAMTALKLSPGTGFGWLVGQGDWRRLAWAIGGLLALAFVGLMGAGIQPWFDYVGVARQTQPSPESLAGLTGLPWLSSAILVGGTVLAAVVRRDRWSFGIAVVASVIGSPALYHAGYIPLLVLAIPLAEALRERAGRAAGTRGDLSSRTNSGHDVDRPTDIPAGVQP